jgi:hypothetical protein
VSVSFVFYPSEIKINQIKVYERNDVFVYTVVYKKEDCTDLSQILTITEEGI